MGDQFSIRKVGTFVAEVPMLEISDISKIIREMIVIKNDITRKKGKRTRVYDINDKMALNKLSDTLKAKIKRQHIDSYDLVDDAINCIEEFEAALRSDLYDYYWEVYIDVLIEMDINIKDKNCIKSNSDSIYSNIISKIDEQLFYRKNSEIETNKKVTYLNAITAYVFYECKFLIPMESQENIQ